MDECCAPCALVHLSEHRRRELLASTGVVLQSPVTGKTRILLARDQLGSNNFAGRYARRVEGQAVACPEKYAASRNIKVHRAIGL